MDPGKLLKEIAFVLSINNLLHAFFNILIGFLGGAILGNIFHHLWYGALGGLFLGILFSFQRLHADWQLFQKKYPFLVDEYLAVKETLNEKNEIVQHLRQDFEKRLKKLSNAEFLTIGAFYKKSLFVLILVFLLIASPLFSFHLPTITLGLPEFHLSLPFLQQQNQKQLEKQNTQHVAQLQGREDRITLHYTYKADLNDIKDPEQENFLKKKTQQLTITADDIYIDSLSQEEEALIKRYFASVKR